MLASVYIIDYYYYYYYYGHFISSSFLFSKFSFQQFGKMDGLGRETTLQIFRVCLQLAPMQILSLIFLCLEVKLIIVFGGIQISYSLSGRHSVV